MRAALRVTACWATVFLLATACGKQDDDAPRKAGKHFEWGPMEGPTTPSADAPFSGASPTEAWEDFAKARAALLEASASTGDGEGMATRDLEAQAKAARAGWKVSGPADALALARFADAFGEPEERASRLEEASRDDGEAGRIATTSLATLALEGHDPAAALPRLERIVKAFAGRGTDERGRAVEASVLAGAIADEAAARARRLVEGVSPDPEAARKALSAGTSALALGGASADDRAPLERAAAYVALGDAPRRLDLWAPGVETGGAPRVVVFADHFQLGEPVLPSVLKRWKKGLSVTVVGLLAGRTRSGIRRVPATPAEERKALEDRGRELGLHVVGGLNPTSSEAAELGLDPAGATVFVLDVTGKIVARAAGNSVDPRVLDPVVTRLAPEAAPEADPSKPPK